MSEEEVERAVPARSVQERDDVLSIVSRRVQKDDDPADSRFLDFPRVGADNY